MNNARRDERDTPRMRQRTFQDEKGRHWTGSLSSGTLQGGERHGEVIFVCRDQPSELKRVARLDVAPAEADERWNRMARDEVEKVFRDSEPA